VDRQLSNNNAAAAAIVAGAALVAAGFASALASGAPLRHPHVTAPTASGFLSAVVMWQAMMIAMMTPTVAPWVTAFGRLLPVPAGSRAGAGSLAFAFGYFSVWLAYSAAAAALQIALLVAGLVGPNGAPPRVAALVLIAAGLFQFAPVRQACLTHCRNPISYLLTRWRTGPPSAFRLGLAHGAYCVGCCWLLMLTGLAVGLMNLAWMALVTVAVAVEQTAPGGVWVGRALGAGLIVWGAVLAWPA
jgi:predicted metal-binding membrane protein